MSIYADLLGSGWKVLPESVRRLHEAGGEGTFRIERHGIARFLPFLPPAGEKISIHLRVIRTGETERWIRTFDGVHVVKSAQRMTRGMIVERFGAVAVGMTIAASADALRYHLVEIRILGSLAEKQLATPEYYPLTLNALVAACTFQTATRPSNVALVNLTDGTMNPNNRRIKSYFQVDVHAGYTLASSLGKTNLFVGISNLFDQAPPYIYSANLANSDPTLYDYLGRYVYGRIQHTF